MQKTVKNLNSKIMNLQVEIKQKEKDAEDQQEKIDQLFREIAHSKEAYDKNANGI